jgi:hypothetical protein
VIDTVGIRTDRPFAMVDMYGTPYTSALHVVERYRLLDYEAAKEGLERAAKENFRLPPDSIPPVADSDPNYRGKHLQLKFTVEDEGVFTAPWSATITYGRPLMGDGRSEVNMSAPKIRDTLEGIPRCRAQTRRISESWHARFGVASCWVNGAKQLERDAGGAAAATPRC